MSRRSTSAVQTRRGSSRTSQSRLPKTAQSDSDDEFVDRPTRASTTRSPGGTEFMRARRTSAPRGRLDPDTTGPRRGNGSGSATVRGNAARARGGGPIFGGRQNQLVRRAADPQRAIAGVGRAYRTRRSNSDENAGGTLNATIVLDEEEDSNEEGEDVEVSGDDEEEEDEFDLEDSFINDESALENTFGAFGDFDDLFSSEDEMDLDVVGEGPPDESFSQEVEEFELMEERENATARRAEERRRRKEDQDEKENKNVLRTEMFGACTVCAEDEVTDPVGCLHCANFIGCRKCATRWYRTSKGNDPQKIASCPLCRQQWTSNVPEVGDMLDLVKPA